jgi:hypothetical protein
VADTHIDYGEVSEYGRYFAAMLETLVGASSLVDAAALRRRVLAEVEAVERERQRARTQQSSARVGRGATGEAVEATGGVLRRFHHHLNTLPPDAAVDRAAFFPRGALGKLSRLKPADLLERAGKVLHGFTVDANAALPDLARWQAEITAAHTRLADALAGKHDAQHGKSLATGALVAARERFLHVYNVIGKRLVYVVLADLGRLDEYPRFFLDLQVNERKSRALPASPGPGNGPATAQ